MTARTGAPAAITLTRAEAVIVDSLLLYTNVAFPIDGDTSTPEGVEAVVRRLRLEAAIREGGGWWDHGSKPGMLDMYEQNGKGTCPDVFTLPADAARALAELLPIAFADALDGDEGTVVAVAARLGVEIPQEVTE